MWRHDSRKACVVMNKKRVGDGWREQRGKAENSKSGRNSCWGQDVLMLTEEQKRGFIWTANIYLHSRSFGYIRQGAFDSTSCKSSHTEWREIIIARHNSNSHIFTLSAGVCIFIQVLCEFRLYPVQLKVGNISCNRVKLPLGQSPHPSSIRKMWHSLKMFEKLKLKNCCFYPLILTPLIEMQPNTEKKQIIT